MIRLLARLWCLLTHPRWAFFKSYPDGRRFVVCCGYCGRKIGAGEFRGGSKA